MTAHERRARDLKIATERAAGRSWEQIAASTGLTARRCQQIVKRLREQQLVEPYVDLFGDEFDARGALEDHVALVKQTITDFADLALTTKNDGVRVAALRSKVEQSAGLMDLLRQLGQLPDHWGAFKAEREMQSLLTEFADLARKFELPEEYVEEVIALSQRSITRRHPAALAG